MRYEKPIYGFLIFFVYGCVLNVYILSVYGFEEQIPEYLKSAWLEPVSLTLLILLAAVVYFFWAFATAFGTINPESGTVRKKILENIVLPAEYTTTNIGVPMLGFVLGSAVIAFIFSLFNEAGKATYISFFLFCVMITSILSALKIIRAYTKNQENKGFVLLGVFVFYAFLGCVSFVFVGGEYLNEVSKVCFLLPILICTTLIINAMTDTNNMTHRFFNRL